MLPFAPLSKLVLLEPPPPPYICRLTYPCTSLWLMQTAVKHRVNAR